MKKIDEGPDFTFSLRRYADAVENTFDDFEWEEIKVDIGAIGEYLVLGFRGKHPNIGTIILYETNCKSIEGELRSEGHGETLIRGVKLEEKPPEEVAVEVKKVLLDKLIKSGTSLLDQSEKCFDLAKKIM